jgi:hypothetical protein
MNDTAKGRAGRRDLWRNLPPYGRAKTSARFVCTPLGYVSLRAGVFALP